MFLMIDNYDSFVYNLKAYFEELGRKILVRRSDQITMEDADYVVDNLKEIVNHLREMSPLYEDFIKKNK